MVDDNSQTSCKHQSERYISTYDDSSNGIDIIDDGLGHVTIVDDLQSIPNSRVSSSTSHETRKVKNTLHHSQLSGDSKGPLEKRKQNRSRLSWRSDPYESFSDWTIEVATVEGNQVTSLSFYHCHSNVLVWGPRKCGEFVKLFQERMKGMPNSSVTQIKLSPAEAAAFPSLLDFLYCETTLSLSAEKICSMYALAEKFDNEMLMTAIQAFVEKYLDLEQSIEFLSHARKLRHHGDKFHKVVLSTHSRICAYLVKHPKDASKVPPEMLAHILRRRAQVMKVLKGEDPRKFSGEWETNRSRVLSTVVSECCFHAATSATLKSTLTRQTFGQLTDPKHIPVLHSNAALQLLVVDSILDSEKGGDDGIRRHDQQSMSSLESRCIKAVVNDWRNLFVENQESAFQEMLPNMRSWILAELLTQVSRKYERLIGMPETPRHHEILGDLQLNAFTNRTSLPTTNATVHSSDDDSMENQKALPLIRKGQYGMHKSSHENLIEECHEEDWLAPTNRHSSNPDHSWY